MWFDVVGFVCLFVCLCIWGFFFCTYLTWVCWAAWLYNDVFYQIWEIFIYLLIYFSISFSLSSSSENPIKWFLDWHFPTGPWSSFHILVKHFFLSVLQIVWRIWRHSLHWCLQISWIFLLLLSLSVEFGFKYYTFQFYNFHIFALIPYMSAHYDYLILQVLLQIYNSCVKVFHTSESSCVIYYLVTFSVSSHV